jgi:hypothetical protein
MPIQIDANDTEKNVDIHISGQLAKEDYEKFVPEFEELMREQGKLRVLIDMTGFHGWASGALWHDAKFDLRHCSEIERLAVVGDKKWMQIMTSFCKPFTKAATQYFPDGDTTTARTWLNAP